MSSLIQNLRKTNTVLFRHILLDLYRVDVKNMIDKNVNILRRFTNNL